MELLPPGGKNGFRIGFFGVFLYDIPIEISAFCYADINDISSYISLAI